MAITLSKPAAWTWTAAGSEDPTLASGLVSLVPIWENDATPPDLITGDSPTTGTGGGPAYNDGTHGGELEFDGTDTLIWHASESPFDGLSEMSLVAVVQINVESNRTMLVKDNTFQFEYIWAGGTNFRYRVRLWSSSTEEKEDFADADMLYDPPNYQVFVLTWHKDDTDIDAWRLDLTTEEEGSETGAMGRGTLDTDSGTDYRWGRQPDDGNPMDGAWVFFAAWNRKLSDADAVIVLNDPYVLIRQGAGSLIVPRPVLPGLIGR